MEAERPSLSWRAVDEINHISESSLVASAERADAWPRCGLGDHRGPGGKQSFFARDVPGVSFPTQLNSTETAMCQR